MGQTQLLLIGLGIAVVAVAVLAGMTLFSEKSEQAHYDLMITEANDLFTDILAWKYKSGVFGGGSSSTYLDSFRWGKIGIEETNGNGLRADNDLFIRQISNVDDERPHITIRPQSNSDLRIQYYIYGQHADCIKVRTGRRVDGEWVNSDISVSRNDPPETCSVW